jgi:hypothetical protein
LPLRAIDKTICNSCSCYFVVFHALSVLPTSWAEAYRCLIKMNIHENVQGRKENTIALQVDD